MITNKLKGGVDLIAKNMQQEIGEVVDRQPNRSQRKPSLVDRSPRNKQPNE